MDQTIAHFEIEYDPDRAAHSFPVRHEGVEKTKYKALPGSGSARYHWGDSKGSTPPLYNAGAIESERICIVKGEPDVWIMHQAGIANTVSGTGETGSFSKSAIDCLKASGVKRAFVAEIHRGRTGYHHQAGHQLPLWCGSHQRHGAESLRRPDQ